MNRSTNSPSTIVIHQPRGGIWRVVTWVGWLGFFICLGLLIANFTLKDFSLLPNGGMREHFHSGNTNAKSKIAIVSVAGVIGDGHGFVKSQIDRIRKDKDVKAVVLRVNSPGGTVYGSDFIYHHLKKLRDERNLPFVVSMGGIATSGGYYVSMVVGNQEDSIYAEPTTTTGSIGVIMPHYDLSGLLKRFDVKNDAISSHPRKQMLSMTRAIPPEHREILQRHVDELFGRFKLIVQEGRPQFRADAAQLDTLATGEMFTAGQAVENGLVDKIGFIEDAIERAMELAKLDKDQSQVVNYSRQPTVVDMLGLIRSQPTKLDLTSALELSAPRAYYLSSSLPPLVQSPLRLPEELVD